MKSIFSQIGVKCFLILISTIVVFSPAYSQDTEIEKKITEAIDNAKTGKSELAIPVLKKYSNNQDLDDLTFLEIQGYLSYCYLVAEGGGIDVERINTLALSYLGNHGILKGDSIKSLKEIELMHLVGIINGAMAYVSGSISTYEQIISFSSVVKKYYDDENIEKDQLYAQLLHQMAFGYSFLGNYKLALEFNQIVAELRKDFFGEKHPDYLSTLNNLASSYLNLGDYQSALEIGLKVVESTKTALGEKHPEYLSSLNNLAVSYFGQGDYLSALAITQGVVEIQKEVLGETHPYYLISLSNLGSTYSQLGDYNSAFAISQEVVKLRREVLGETHPDYLRSLDKLSISYRNLGNYESAITISQDVVKIQKEVLGETHPDYLTCLSNLALLYSDLGNYESALNIIQTVVEITKEVLGEAHPNYLTSLSNLGLTYSQLGDYNSAFAVIQKAVEIEKEVLGEENPGYTLSLSNLAISEFNTGKNDLALSHFIQSLNLRQERAIKYFGQLTESQRENFWAQNNFSFEVFPMFIEKTSNSKPEEISIAFDIALFTKGLLLNTTLDFEELLTENGTPEALGKYDELKLQKLQLQRLYERPIAERYLNVDSLETIAQKLETELVKLSKEYGDYTQNLKINWKDVQAKLGEKDVAIEFLEYPTLTDTIKYAALVLRKGWDNPKFVPLFRKDQIEEFIKRDPNQIYSNGFVGKEIKKLVWNPLEEFIAPGDKVYFSAAGIFHQLAIENLSVNDSATLGDRYQLYRLSSTKELALKKPEYKTKAVALYGGIRYDLEIDQMIAESEKYQEKETVYALRGITQDSTSRKGWQFLPGTLAEAEEISKILDENQYRVDEFLGEIGSEESFKALSGKKTGIIHIATHGFFLPVEESRGNRFLQMRGDQRENVGYVDPMQRAGLMLAGGNRAWQGDTVPDTIEDGILTAKEISHVDLRGTDLVVLSACETGLGDVSSEGVFGLQRAFKQAGAQTIIMSLWNVKDEATQQMMTNFYTHLMQGASKRKAFIQARNQCREQYPDPEYWAAFIILD